MTNPTKIPGGNTLLDAQKVLETVGITQNMKVGDFGCGGLGYFTLTAAKMVGRDGVVYAVDILKSVLGGVAERAKAENLDNVKTIWSNLEIYGATKIDNESLDIGLLINILFQAKKDSDIIKECLRLVKPGGKLLIVDWKQTGAPLGPPPQERVSLEGIKQIAQNLGLKEEQSFEAGPYHFGIIFVKQV
ncbi:class I SAM-dependent methyltransferase [Patescibacteria group bacterium]|nr:class I SAM-dependent methyltransferase [Patescibacteria group bacterium]MBU4512184.1 class I SAM-dependent methyltransferase [Patescibacteria group bacterium]MCG2693466.1 class I SAM-dependent methyltransferase [Candidatus Parcubacteria bacterium]